MAKLIFVNLPVTDLHASTAFYEAVGATKNPQFSDDTAACMVFSDTIHVMLLTHDKFASSRRSRSPTRTRRARCCSASPPTAATRSTRSSTRPSPPAASPIPAPKQDYGFMYGRSFEDPDGHHLGASMWMDMAALGDQNAAEAAAASVAA